MTYELAKQLKDAGFPQDKASKRCDRNVRSWFVDDSAFCENGGHLTRGGVKRAYIPSLSELIEECGNDFGALELFDEGWVAGGKTKTGMGFKLQATKTPEESVANLWIVLNKK